MRKAKKGKKTTRRRRSIGATKINPNNPLLKIAAVVGGYLLADQINPGVDKLTGGKMNEKLLAGAEGSLGGVLMFMKLGKKKPIIQIAQVAAGGLLAGAGLKRALKSFGVISGYGSVPVLGRRRVSGYGDVPVLGAYRSPGQLNGYTSAGQLNSIVRPLHQKVMGSTGSGHNGMGCTNHMG